MQHIIKTPITPPTIIPDKNIIIFYHLLIWGFRGNVLLIFAFCPQKALLAGIAHSHAPCGRASEPTCRQTIIAPDPVRAPEAPSHGHSPHGAYSSALRPSPFHHRVRPPYTAPAGHRDPFRPDSFHRRSIHPCSAETLYCRWTRRRCGSVRCIVR